jgi:small subunit ribosomal protein S1
MRSWDRVNASLEKDEIITGYIKCRTKGGMIVDVFGIEAFLPGSQIDVKPIRDYDVFVGKQWNSRLLRSTRNSKTLLFLTKLLLKLNLNSRKRDHCQT